MADNMQKPHSASVIVGCKDEKTKSKIEFSEDEETLITRMYNLVGEKWALIAGRIPGRNADEIEKYWKSKHFINKSTSHQKELFPGRKLMRIRSADKLAVGLHHE